jgi:1,2-diacylglycerol 3-beta-galactosyltransferase
LFSDLIVCVLQEAGNVPYVVDGGFGVYTGNRPNKIANTVYEFFRDEEKLERMSKIARSLSRPEATHLISKDIVDIVLRKTQELPTFKNKDVM